MRLSIGGKLLSALRRAFCASIRALPRDDGNVAMTFAIAAVPLCIAIGASVDYARAYNTQAKMQTDLDAALIAAIKEVDTLDETAIQADIVEWFNAQADTGDASYSLSNSTITVSKVDRTVKAIARGTVKTSFLALANINTINVAAVSSVAGPATSYMNVYLVIDKSPSMLLAASSSDQAKLRADSNITCEFACHSTVDPVYKKGTTQLLASNYYNYVKATYGAQLRSDVAINAVTDVLDMIDEADSSHERIKVGLYKLGATTSEVLAPTLSTSTARKYITTDSYGLTSATSESATYFDIALPALQKLVGTAGDGSSATKPLKLVLLLTDGVQSERNWVLWWLSPTYNVLGWQQSQSDSTKQEIWKAITPLNPNWCSGMKTNGATVGVLYTKYLPITSDWGYNETVGKSMSSSKFVSLWKGTIKSGVSSSISRQSYIPYALGDCASSTSMFLSASDPAEIEGGLSSLFSQYLGSVRLTQ